MPHRMHVVHVDGEHGLAGSEWPAFLRLSLHDFFMMVCQWLNLLF